MQELGDLWGELQANCQRKAAKLQEACEVRPAGYGAGHLGHQTSPLTSILPQALRLRRSAEELESWLESVEVELSTPTRNQDQPALEELLGAQGELELAQPGCMSSSRRGRASTR